VGWDKLRELTEVQAEGKRALRERDAHLFAMKSAQADLDMLEARVGAVDRLISELLQAKPSRDGFATSDDLAQWQVKLDELHAARAGFNEQRRPLNVTVAQARMAILKLDRLIETLQRSQNNLQAVVDGKKPDEGWQGGLYRVR
jgi:chromosome segregation ATPase